MASPLLIAFHMGDVSVPALRLSLIGRKSRGAFVSATLIGQSKKENGLKRILFFCVRTP